jgi:CelD/BcsL family acetyltransferase involved in cellulose biosynthesis
MMIIRAEHDEASRTSNHPAPAAPVVVDPLQHPGWDSLLADHPQATIFHGTGWARVLRDTYGHNPVYVGRFDGARLTGLIPVMEVSSRLTGRRGVSLPFTDFCPALSNGEHDSRELYSAAMELGRRRGWKYLECRDAAAGWEGATPSLAFYGHTIDLTAGTEELFNRLDSAVRRGIRKAEEAGLKAEFAGSTEAMETYYGLHCQTRKRHGLPPQPVRFFRNIQRHILDSGQGFVAIVRLQERALAAGVFFLQGGQALYKFGASDFAFQQMRPNNLMMWAGIQQCAALGASTLHLGRTSLEGEGLRRFKLSLGASEETVPYCRYDFSSGNFVKGVDHAEGWFNHVFGSLPLPILRLAGRILYPHLS